MLPPTCCPISYEKIPHKLSSILSSPDIYHKIEYLDFLTEPYFLGISEHTADLIISSFEESAIFRFCSFDGEILPWPSTFQINICGKWIKKTTNDHSLFHYLPSGISLIGRLSIKCEIESIPFLFIIQKVRINSELLFSIPVLSGNNEIIKSQISGKKMLFPVRSKFCKHNQCVEIDEYVEYVDRKGKCPICGIPVSLSSTIVDSENHRKALIESLQSQQKSDQSLFDFNDFF